MAELAINAQRKTLLGKSVITLDDASKAGTINEVWVDTKSRRVAAIGFQAKGRNANLAIAVDAIQVLGEDAVLIPNSDTFLDELPETYVRFVDHEVVTEGGKRVGQVDDYYFDRTTGEITNFLLSAGGISGFLEGHTRLEGDELVVIGKERSIVKAGADERLIRVDKGLQQWVEVGSSKVKETASKVQETASKVQETASKVQDNLKERIGTGKKEDTPELPAAPSDSVEAVVEAEKQPEA